jgi:hypothetical protein
MTKDQLLSEIYQSTEVKVMIASLQPKHLQQDILQHCFLELFEKKEEFILDLHTRGKLKHYIVKILYNTARFSRTTFAKTLGQDISFSDVLVTKPTENYADSLERFEQNIENNDALIEYEADQREVYDQVYFNLSGLYWYKAEIFKLYAGVKECENKDCDNLISTDDEGCLSCHSQNTHRFKSGTYQSISDLTRIPLSSIYKTVQEVIANQKNIFFKLSDKAEVRRAIIREWYREKPPKYHLINPLHMEESKEAIL